MIGRDSGLFLLRATLGGLLVGHGAQKLFGAFEGHGIERTGEVFERLGLAPGRPWAITAGLSESAGGMLTAVGLLWPVGPLMTLAPMTVAWGRAHWGKPIWVTSGGAELPATNIAIASALAVLGPGRWSLDHWLGVRAHPAVAALAAAAVTAGTMTALTQRPGPANQATTPEGTPAPANQTATPEGTVAGHA